MNRPEFGPAAGSDRRLGAPQVAPVAGPRHMACLQLLLGPAAGIKRGSFSRVPVPWVGPTRLKDQAMSKVCQITGKRPMSGNTVSHANNRKRRRFLPNLHTQRFWLESEKRWVSLKVSGNGMRTIDKKGVEVVVNELRAQGVKI